MSAIPHIASIQPGEIPANTLCDYCAEYPATSLVLVGEHKHPACDECAAAVRQGRDAAHYHYCTCWDCTGFPSPMGYERGRENETVDCDLCCGPGEVTDPETGESDECPRCGGTGAIHATQRLDD